ncbi:M23 family metallopeptidase [Pseudoduganella plicata]|uniref:M23 family metallopeptidase n=1 Tax=Pseudoduganella plicata TaxID=321984 RepID=A0A4P7BL59_9BURK|nr:M23 family metallopeptidase [Pseudoduganella plicata]QBQ39113.1 M23 family metallopeptidase [Pseudoduganella plicata]GGY87433.1 hypothetical protein GCM10007388_20940 [Pseudoduganella plicata]
MKWLLTLLLGIAIGVVGAVLYLGRDVASAGTPAPGPAVMPARAAAPPTASQGTAPPQAAAAVPLPPGELPEVVPPAPVSPVPAGVEMNIKPTLGALLVPVAGVSAKELTDTFNQARGSERRHEALDIVAAKGTPVLAAADGKVAKLFNSKQGGLTVYQFDPSEKYAYYYAHLDSYAPDLKEGQQLRRGQMLGYVGVTGNSDPNAPHLHFAIFELGADKKWWEGTPVNPYPHVTGAPR